MLNFKIKTPQKKWCFCFEKILLNASMGVYAYNTTKKQKNATNEKQKN